MTDSLGVRLAAAVLALAVAFRVQATIQVSSFGGCRISLTASPVPGAVSYRWFIERNGCGTFDRQQVGITDGPSCALEQPLAFDQCWFRVDAVSSTGQVLQAEYSTSSPPTGTPGFGGGGSESAVRAGPPRFDLLGFDRVWVDALVGQMTQARWWLRGLEPAGCDIQWMRNGVPIPGAQAESMEMLVGLPDSGARISVRVTNPCGQVTVAERTLEVVARPVAQGFQWDFLSQSNERMDSSWCCFPNMAYLRRRYSWSATSGNGVQGVNLHSVGASLANTQSGIQGGVSNTIRLGFVLHQWMRMTYSVTASNYVFPSGWISASLEGASIPLPVYPPGAHGPMAAALPPGSFVLTSTCRAGMECCGGPTCQSMVFGSTGWSISFSLAPLCEVDPTHPACCVGNIDAAGVVDGSDLGLLLSAWGPCHGGCGADLNSDGVVDGADLGVLLNAWGTCSN